MASTISALGLGSSGVLTSDVLDQLRAVDTAAQVTPIETKISLNETKQSDLTILTTLTATLKASTSTLSDESSYLQRSVTSSNSAVTVSASAGSAVQDFSVHVNSLAQRDIYQSTGFASETSTFSGATLLEAGTVIAPTLLATQGEGDPINITETTTLSFNATSMSAGDTLSIGGLTLTATGTITRAEALAAFANLNAGATSGNSVSNGAWSGTLNDFNSGAISGTELTFTSTTPNTDVTDLSVSATQQVAQSIPVPSDYIFSITLGSKTYDIDMTSGTTLQELKDKITDATEGKITASLLNVGGTNPYKLIIKANETGEDNTLSFSSTSTSALKNLGLDSASLVSNGNHLQTAANASFTYNGTTITRSSNTITDLVVGLSITLNEKQADQDTQTYVSVKQDLSLVKEALTSMVSAYNTLSSNLIESTKYDSETKNAGTFQNTSEIKSLKSALKKQLLQIDSEGRSLTNYGISFNDAGLLELDNSVFEEKLSSDANDVEDYFRATTREDLTTSDGFFTQFNTLLGEYITGKNSILTLYQANLVKENSTLNTNKDTAIARLDSRYDILTTKFAAYDSIISQLNTQFETLSMMIEESYNSDN